MNKGKLIVIESGTDGSGKATQSKMLVDKLVDLGLKAKLISFPNYKSEASSLIKMYLRGDFGEKANEVSPYVASSFYAVDRYASYQSEWKDFYLSGGIIVLDRYVTSNMVHQGTKLEPKDREVFFEWLEELEYGMYGIPKPDKVIFLDVEPSSTENMRRGRNLKIEGDIHESDSEYMEQSYRTALEIAKDNDWSLVDCIMEDGQIRSVQDIHSEIVENINSCLF